MDQLISCLESLLGFNQGIQSLLQLIILFAVHLFIEVPGLGNVVLGRLLGRQGQMPQFAPAAADAVDIIFLIIERQAVFQA